MADENTPAEEGDFLSMGMILDSPMLLEMVRWYKEDRMDMKAFRQGITEEGVNIPPDVTDDMLACLQVCARMMTKFGFTSSSVASAHMIDWFRDQERGYFIESVEHLIGQCIAEMGSSEQPGKTLIEKINLALDGAGVAAKVEAAEDHPGAYRVVHMEG